MLCQALPNYLSAFFESFLYFILSILAAKIGNEELASHNVCVSLFEVSITFAIGMAEATAVRIGFYVGRGHEDCAKSVATIGLLGGLIWGSSVGLFVYLVRANLAAFLSTDKLVQDNIIALCPLIAPSYAIDSIGKIFMGILEGQGRAAEQAKAFCIGSWGCAVPLAMISFFCTDLGLEGIWLSTLLGKSLTNSARFLFPILHLRVDRN